MLFALIYFDERVAPYTKVHLLRLGLKISGVMQTLAHGSFDLCTLGCAPTFNVGIHLRSYWRTSSVSQGAFRALRPEDLRRVVGVPTGVDITRTVLFGVVA